GDLLLHQPARAVPRPMAIPARPAQRAGVPPLHLRGRRAQVPPVVPARRREEVAAAAARLRLLPLPLSREPPHRPTRGRRIELRLSPPAREPPPLPRRLLPVQRKWRRPRL